MSKTERIELHCHTKMGGNATVYVGEIISHLSDISMDAVAITDTSNIYAFTEMDSFRMSKYSTRPIYGMEALVNILWSGTPASFSILVKDEIGKKSIFRIVSTIAEDVKYPIFNFEDIKKNRDGLLFGTGARNGILYLLAEQGVSDYELCELIGEFDYVEVVPDEDCMEITKRLIELAGTVNKPVVAVSDAHYIDKNDKLAWKILQNWDNSSILTRDRHLFTTEEMLDSFDYLAKEKAYEIVVTNTHMIADMCRSIEVIPKVSPIMRIPNDINLLRNKCEKALQSRYTGKKKALAEERLKIELEAIEHTCAATQLLLASELIDRLHLDANHIVVRGSAGGSVVAYLLGISNVDSTQYDLPWEFIFGLKKDRGISIEINIPYMKSAENIRAAEQLNNINAVYQAGFTNSVSPVLAAAMIERYEDDNFTYFDEKERDFLRMKLVGNYRKRMVRQDSFLFSLEGENVYDEMPVVSSGANKTTYFSALHYNMLYSINIYQHKSLEILSRLSKRTGMDISEIPANDDVSVTFLCNATVSSDEYNGIPQFDSEYVREIIELTKPSTFEELVKVLALSNGTDVWEGNAKELIQTGQISLRDVISMREDLYESLLGYGVERESAYSIAEAVRKGIVSRAKNMQWSSWKKLLVEKGVPDWFIQSCEKIKYLFPRAHSISYAIMYVRLAWFKLNYPDDFTAVLREMSID